MASGNVSDSLFVESHDDTPGPAPPVNIKRNAFTTAAFKALQSDDERKVLDIVDKLRRSSLNGHIELPQLVVCGDQSSGKSSVLEGITEIPFPRKENMCTQFATEIVLRRSTRDTISVRITPYKSRTEQECKKLREFSVALRDFKQLPGVIDEATQAMGLGKSAGTSRRTKTCFSQDVLSIEICGPDRPQLTLVDLPGLIHTTGKGQSAGDKALVFDLVGEYMKNPRTIILAVISSKNDWQNQVILEDCRKIDPHGRRTLGIITKPDAIAKSDVANWIDLAMNKHIYFERGWHILKNRGPDQMSSSFEERNKAEKEFLTTSRFKVLDDKHRGIEALRTRLSDLLLDHLIKELPSVREEIKTKLQATLAELESMGEKRTTIAEQKLLLIRMSLDIQNILKSAVIGYYDNPFFGPPDMEASVETKNNIHRFRAVVQHLNKQFARTMTRQGHKLAIACGPGDDDIEMAEAEEAEKELAKLDKGDLGSKLHKPKALTRQEAVAWVQKVLERSRGSELPGNFNPMLISQLFWEQSAPWEDIAVEHINKVSAVCKVFVDKVLKHTALPEFQDRLKELCVEKALKDARIAAEQELAKLIADKAGHPMTYNHYFTTSLQKQRQKKHQQIAQNAAKQAETTVNYTGTTRPQVDPLKMAESFANSIEQDMDKFSAEEALDNQRAYYKDERMYFISAVVKTVIERHLVEPLPQIILSPLIITQMTDEEVNTIAQEAKETTQRRNYLDGQKCMLESGLETFREAMSSLKR